MSTTYNFHSRSTSHSLSQSSLSSQPPTVIPSYVYRVHRASAQTRYSFQTGFFAKNQTTIVNYTSGLSRFGIAHINQQTNISSPFISVYDNPAHAEAVAKHFASKYGEDTLVVTVDTKHLARGPLFRAADLLSKDGGDVGQEKKWLHYGEYLVMYRIPPQAIRQEVPIKIDENQRCRAVGVIGGGYRS